MLFVNVFFKKVSLIYYFTGYRIAVVRILRYNINIQISRLQMRQNIRTVHCLYKGK